MKKLLLLTIAVGFFTGCNRYVAPQTPTKHEIQYPKNKQVLISAIQQAAQKEAWKAYRPSTQHAYHTQTLYFKKRIKNNKLYAYRYQNRFNNKHTDLHVKVRLKERGFDVKFVDEVRMNIGRMGIDSNAKAILQAFKEAISAELETKSS